MAGARPGWNDVRLLRRYCEPDVSFKTRHCGHSTASALTAKENAQRRGSHTAETAKIRRAVRHGTRRTQLRMCNDVSIPFSRTHPSSGRHKIGGTDSAALFQVYQALLGSRGCLMLYRFRPVLATLCRLASSLTNSLVRIRPRSLTIIPMVAG